MYPQIETFIQSLDTNTIPAERVEILNQLLHYIREKSKERDEVRLNFICTHNSRRSHLGQIWAQTMQHYYKISKVHCYSGGTEATALFPEVANSLKNIGFTIQKLSVEQNPVYAVKFDPNSAPIVGFSKVYDHPFNPKNEFAAVMTCSHADENCPFIPGAETRISLTYEDPKVADNTPQQTEKYAERSKQIATEMKYVFSQIN